MERKPVTAAFLSEVLGSKEFKDNITTLLQQRSWDHTKKILGSIFDKRTKGVVERGFDVYIPLTADSYTVTGIAEGEEDHVSGVPVNLDLENPDDPRYLLLDLHHEPPTDSYFASDPFAPSTVKGDLFALKQARIDLQEEWGMDARPIMAILRGDTNRARILLLQERDQPHTNEELQEIEDKFVAIGKKAQHDDGYHKILRDAGYNLLFTTYTPEFGQDVEALKQFEFTPQIVDVSK